MKITLLKIARRKEVMNRLELSTIVEMIRNNPEKQKVYNLRLNYPFLKPERKEDGQSTDASLQWIGGGRGERTGTLRGCGEHSQPSGADG